MEERYPLEPFLPENAKVLFLGSFPPPRQRWCMDFYYPNFQNDHWRIEGAVWFNDRNYFVDVERKCFDKEKIVCFLNEKGIALYDTAQVVRRLKGNASDAFLEIVEPTDLKALLRRIPNAMPLRPQARRRRGRCVAISAWTKFRPWVASPNWSQGCRSIGCRRRLVPIPWHSRKR